MAQDLAHFFFHRAAVLGRPQAQLTLQRVVKAADQEGWHRDIDDIIDINAFNACIVW